MANAINKANQPNANIFIDQLKSQSKEEQGLKWWTANDQNVANDIEITAYAALTLLDTAGDHTSILKWLIKKRNANGGFTSSFDTVVGMEALVKFSEKYKNLENVNLKISYKAKDEQGNEVARDNIRVDSSDILDLKKHELPKNTRQVTFEMEGSGACLVQLNQQYNIDFEDKFRYFNIKTQPSLLNPEEFILKICFTYQTDSEVLNEVTNMIIMEVNLPSGYRSEAENDKDLKNNKLVQKIESRNLETTIILYLDKLEANTEHCLEIPADKTNEIMLMKPAAIIMYDYYNLTRSNTDFYYL